MSYNIVMRAHNEEKYIKQVLELIYFHIDKPKK